MKRKGIFLLWCFFLFFLRSEASQLSLKVCGGLSWINGGDFNKNICGWRDYYRDHDISPYSFTFNLKEPQGLWEGRAELLYSVSSRFEIGIGLEFLAKQVSGEMSWSLNQNESYFHSQNNYGNISIKEESFKQPKYNLQVIPVTLSAYYSIDFGKRLILAFGGGVGYYYGRLKYIEGYNYSFDYVDELTINDTLTKFVDQYSSSGEYSEKSTSHAIGFHGGASFELRISRRFSFVVEGLGRIVSFNEWEGQKSDKYSWEHTWGFWGAYYDQGNEQEVREGKLWLVEVLSRETGKSYPRFVFSKEKPVSSFYEDVREAGINLDGFSLRIGFRVHF